MCELNGHLMYRPEWIFMIWIFWQVLMLCILGLGLFKDALELYSSCGIELKGDSL